MTEKISLILDADTYVENFLSSTTVCREGGIYDSLYTTYFLFIFLF